MRASNTAVAVIRDFRIRPIQNFCFTVSQKTPVLQAQMQHRLLNGVFCRPSNPPSVVNKHRDDKGKE
jgi:hypothetical protein